MHTRPIWLLPIIFITILGLAACESQDSETVNAELSTTINEKDLPADLADATWEKIQSGKVSSGQAIVETLKIMNSELTVTDVFGSRKMRPGGGTGVIRMANAYLKTGKEEKYKKGILRLLKKIFPKKKNRHKKSSRFFYGLIANAEAERRIPGFRSWTQGGKEYSINFPSDWEGQPDKMARVNATSTALSDAYRVFNRLGPPGMSGKISVTIKPELDDKNYAVTWADDDCDIRVSKLGTKRKIPNYKQTIAHEVFHCFQYWNMEDQFLGDDSVAWDHVSKWWIEGSATYFENVVYPCSNDEWQYTGDFDAYSVNRSILYHRIAYGNFIFFQYLANQPAIGNQGIIRLLKSLPASGRQAAQGEALARFTGMQEHFQKFGRAYLNKKIADACYNTMIKVKPGADKIIVVSKPDTHKVEAKQFQLARRLVKFKPGWQYKLTKKTEGPKGKEGLKEKESELWNTFPEEVNTGCGKREHVLLVTSAVPAGGRHKFNMIVTSSVETQTRVAKIDQCLVGTWEIQNPSHDSVVRSAISKTRMNVRFQSSGKQTTHFTRGCKATMTFKNYKTKSKFSYPAMAFLNTTTTSNGTDTVDYIAAGGVITFSNLKEGMCARMETKGRVRISRRKGWKNIRTTTTECGPYAKGKNAGKRQTTSRVGGKSYDVGKAQKAFDINKILKFREQQRKKMRDSGFDPNQFLAKYGRSPRSGGNSRYKIPDKIKMPNIGMPVGQAEKEDSLFMGKVEYQCSGNRLTMRTIVPTTSDKSWEFRRVKK